MTRPRPRITRLARPLRRRIGEDLVVRITAAGLELRGYRRRRVRTVSWEELQMYLATRREGADDPSRDDPRQLPLFDETT